MERLRVERELYVASALYFERAYYAKRAVAQQMILFVCERLAGRYYYAVARMYSDGVDVFHVTDSYRGVVSVADNFVFYLFESLYALFYKDLSDGGETESVFHYLYKLFFVVGKTAARSAERECGAQNNGIAYILCRLFCFFYRVRYFGGERRLSYLYAKVLEELAVFRLLYTFAARAEKLYLAFVKNAFLFELHCKVKTGLSAKSRDYRVGALVTEYLCHVFERERFHVYFICDGRIRHYRRGVGVCEYYFISFFFERKARLCSRIVEFRRLTYYDRTGTDDEYFL